MLSNFLTTTFEHVHAHKFSSRAFDLYSCPIIKHCIALSIFSLLHRCRTNNVQSAHEMQTFPNNRGRC